ncbi:hypothetical protein DOTSEDRAFT_73674 [Dothistroma septosporum NZE10]|uniref:Uncharacterized protein n=1 Tax=Dothistroma septosporum (strain NZE10 / CBS 128990) TaxID=675120 RepID=N1PGS6_DOTSN|nr:hypothetical protein DOTSEDRAFT_73674 [Dothistroma septosporum NZE10]
MAQRASTVKLAPSASPSSGTEYSTGSCNEAERSEEHNTQTADRDVRKRIFSLADSSQGGLRLLVCISWQQGPVTTQVGDPGPSSRFDSAQDDVVPSLPRTDSLRFRSRWAAEQPEPVNHHHLAS